MADPASLPPTPDHSWWEAQHKLALQSDQIAAGIGLDALKAMIYINAGAVVAIIAFAGQVWAKEGGNQIIRNIMDASFPFLLGVIAGMIAFPIAYFYQSAVTFLIFRSLDAKNKRPRWAVWVENVSRILMLVFALVSLTAFIAGAVRVRNAFAG